ncbi:MAG: DUF1571 domain-containing protein [Bacteroidia bacterium]
MIRFFLTLILFSGMMAASAQDTSGRKILNKMTAAGLSLHSSKFILHSTERMRNGQLRESEMLVKIQNHPLNYYVYCINPSPGAEALWREKTIGERLLINPNGFPYITLKLSPSHPLLRKESHHSILELGFDYLINLVEFYEKKMGPDFYQYISVTDTILWEKRSCIVMSFDYPLYNYETYTVRIGETISSIAATLHLNDFSLLLLNPSVKSYDAVKPGQVIRVPNLYCKKIVLYVDRGSWLPLVQEVYDGFGLYEKYEFRSYLQNPSLSPDEFSPDYPKYKF